MDIMKGIFMNAKDVQEFLGFYGMESNKVRYA